MRREKNRDFIKLYYSLINLCFTRQDYYGPGQQTLGSALFIRSMAGLLSRHISLAEFSQISLCFFYPFAVATSVGIKSMAHMKNSVLFILILILTTEEQN